MLWSATVAVGAPASWLGSDLPLAVGCGEGPSGDGTVASALLPQNRNVDILFMVDDSSSMRLTQDT